MPSLDQPREGALPAGLPAAEDGQRNRGAGPGRPVTVLLGVEAERLGEVGEGRMTIVESRADELVRIKLEFFKPFAATNSTEFTFRPEGGRTAVSWSMQGSNNFIGKAIGLFLDFDRMIGADFEAGLANLRAVVEK